MEENQPPIQRRHHQHHTRPKKRHTFLKVLLIILAVLIVGGGVYAYKVLHDVKNTANKVYKSSGSNTKHLRNSQTALAEHKPISILLLGADTGELGRTYRGRSDTMIIMTINPDTKKTTMTSIPRDTKAHIVGKGSTFVEKINSAYSYGGSSMAINTTQELLNVPIDYYITVNMKGIEKIVNAVDGVNVNVPFTFTYEGVTYKKGEMHLNGKKALGYSRMRYNDPEGDYGRQKRQRQVITSIIKSAVSVKTLWNFGDILQTMSDNVQTDLTYNNMQTIQKNYRSAAANISDDHLQGQNATIDGSSYQVATTKELQRVSNKIRTQLGLKHETVNNLITKQNSSGETDSGGTNSANPYTN